MYHCAKRIVPKKLDYHDRILLTEKFLNPIDRKKTSVIIGVFKFDEQKEQSLSKIVVVLF